MITLKTISQGDYLPKGQLVIGLAVIAVESAVNSIPLFEKARQGGEIVKPKQNGPFGLVCMSNR